MKGPAVLALFEDKSGNIWFGNNGYGLFRYDPSLDDTTGHLKSLTNFTEEHGLSNPEFFKSLQVSTKSGLGTMARIYSINQDDKGDIWIGTVDAGVWRYDGKNLTNYTTNDGLNSNVINVIYKDRKGELWFGTTAGINKFNGVSFTRFFIK